MAPKQSLNYRSERNWPIRENKRKQENEQLWKIKEPESKTAFQIHNQTKETYKCRERLFVRCQACWSTNMSAACLTQSAKCRVPGHVMWHGAVARTRHAGSTWSMPLWSAGFCWVAGWTDVALVVVYWATDVLWVTSKSRLVACTCRTMRVIWLNMTDSLVSCWNKNVSLNNFLSLRNTNFREKMVWSFWIFIH